MTLAILALCAIALVLAIRVSHLQYITDELQADAETNRQLLAKGAESLWHGANKLKQIRHQRDNMAASLGVAANPMILLMLFAPPGPRAIVADAPGSATA